MFASGEFLLNTCSLQLAWLERHGVLYFTTGGEPSLSPSVAPLRGASSCGVGATPTRSLGARGGKNLVAPCAGTKYKPPPLPSEVPLPPPQWLLPVDPPVDVTVHAPAAGIVLQVLLPPVQPLCWGHLHVSPPPAPPQLLLPVDPGGASSVDVAPAAPAGLVLHVLQPLRWGDFSSDSD